MRIDELVRLLNHRGPLYIVKETWTKGDECDCPRCKGSGRFDAAGGGSRFDAGEGGSRFADGPGSRQARSSAGSNRACIETTAVPLVPQPTSVCAVCEGGGRAMKKFVVQEVPRWYFQVTDEGIEFSVTLKREDIEIFFNESDAQSRAHLENHLARTAVVDGQNDGTEL